MPDKVIINSENVAALNTLVNDPRGWLARELEFIAEEVVVPIVKNAIGVPATFTTNDRGHRNWERNEPPGPPKMRTGNLVSSIEHTRAKRDSHGLLVEVTAVSLPRTRFDRKGNSYIDEYDYVALFLVPRNYFFVLIDDDPRFTQVPRSVGQ